MKQTVLITGTSSGIGKATAQYFAQQGWQVAATMRNPEKDQELAKMAGIRVFKLDVTDSTSIATAFDAVEAAFGKIDVVVNNAGYGVDGVFEAMSDAVIERQFNTNVFGLMRVTREAIQRMRPAGGGTIIQIASMGGRLAFPLYSIYHGTKWAVEGFSEALQYELRGLNIKLRLIEPGAIKTEFYGAGRVFVKPEGTSAYDALVEKGVKLSMETGEKGASPEVVAKAVLKAATATGWKLRYPVGAPAPMLLLLKKLLPESWFFAIVRSNYKI